MKIALIGATGFVGTAVLAELLRRDHRVTALVRNPSKLAARPLLAAQALDADRRRRGRRRRRGPRRRDLGVQPRLGCARAVRVSSCRAAPNDAGVAKSGVKRLLVVGGAGGLFVAAACRWSGRPSSPCACRANIIPGAKAAHRVRAGALAATPPSTGLTAGPAGAGRAHWQVPWATANC